MKKTNSNRILRRTSSTQKIISANDIKNSASNPFITVFNKNISKSIALTNRYTRNNLNAFVTNRKKEESSASNITESKKARYKSIQEKYLNINTKIKGDSSKQTTATKNSQTNPRG